MTSDTRDKMAAGAADLLSRRGMHGTSLREVVRHTDTPRGSIGYHFPGGKAQLIDAAVRLAQQRVSEILERVLREHGAVEGVREAFALRAASLGESCFEAGCPVLAVAVERYTDDAKASPDAGAQQRLLDAANTAFRDWQAIIAAALEREGVAAPRAGSLAALVVSSIEGAVALCRAALSLEPINAVGAEVCLLVRTAISDSQPRGAAG